MELDKLILKREEGLEKDFVKFQKEFESQLLSVLQEFSNKNKLEYTDNQLAKLKKAIDDAFNQTNYRKYVEEYLKTFDDIIQDNIQFYTENKILTENYILNSDYFKEIRRQAIDSLLGTKSIDANFKQPIENIMRIDIIRGLSYKDAADNLKGALGEYESRVKTIVKDSLNQFDGAINEDIRKEFKLKRMIWINSIIDTSRPVCRHFTSKKYWTEDEIKKSLQEYIPNGIPSEATETFMIDGKEKRMKKGSGMIEGTDITNITIRRGGYGCRHIVRWVR